MSRSDEGIPFGVLFLAALVVGAGAGVLLYDDGPTEAPPDTGTTFVEETGTVEATTPTPTPDAFDRITFAPRNATSTPTPDAFERITLAPENATETPQAVLPTPAPDGRPEVDRDPALAPAPPASLEP